MALSDEELKLLQQMEAALAEEDPKLANTLRGTGTRAVHKKRAALAGLGFVVGMTALVAGMRIHPIVSVLGFIIMLASTVIALTSWRQVDGRAEGIKTHVGAARSQASASDTAFMDLLEERWRRRQDEGN